MSDEKSRRGRDYLWIGTYDGLSRYRNGTFKSMKAAEGIKGNFVNSVYEDKEKNIWLATNKGLYIIKNGTIDPVQNEMTEYLPDIPIACILMEGDTVWISTHGAGLKRFKNGTFTSITTANGLGSDFIYQMLPDNNGNIWIQADFDVLRVGKIQLNRFADGEIDAINTVHYGVSDGLKSNRFFNTFSRNSVLETKDGQFLYATHKGVSMVEPASIRINKQPPSVVLEYLLLVRARGYGDQLVTFPRPPTEEWFWQANLWQFYFTAPSFLSPEKVRFKVKLEGFDQQWKTLPPTRRRIAIYKNLCAGQYTFRVKGCNSDGVWSPDGASFTFTVKMCFSHTLAYKLILIAAGLLVLIGLLLMLGKWKRRRRKNHRYRRSHLNQSYVREILKKLEHQMKVRKIYRDENLTLQALATELSIHSRYLSQVINENLDMNFSDYINKNRIEEAKKLLSAPHGKDRKILAVAFEVGFNTKAAFNIAFKKYTGMTPSQYREKVS